MPCENPIHFVNGCFCLFHDGHRHLLREAAKGAWLLIVAINSDASVQRLKGERNVDHILDRIANVTEFLNEIGVNNVVTVFSDDTPERIIHEERPDVLVCGNDRTRPMAGEEFVLSYGGKIKIVERLPGISTTEILERTTSCGN